MADSYMAPLNHNYNGSTTIAISPGEKTLTFKDASGGLTRAKRLFIRIDPPMGFTGYIHYKLYSQHGTVASAAVTNFFLQGGETLLEIPFFCAQMKFLNTDAGLTADIFIDAYSDVDISGAAWT